MRQKSVVTVNFSCTENITHNSQQELFDSVYWLKAVFALNALRYTLQTNDETHTV